MYLRTRGLGFTLLSDSPSVVRSSGDEFVSDGAYELYAQTGDMRNIGAQGTDTSWMAWLNRNATKVMIGAGAFLALMLVKGRR